MKRNLVKGCLWQRWKDVPNYEGYYRCSSLGIIKSLSHFALNKSKYYKLMPERILKPFPTRKGYLMVRLYKDRIHHKNIQIHKLVSICFLNHFPSKTGKVVDHKNGNKKRNFSSNLQLVTARENNSICYRKNKDGFSSKYVGVSWSKSNSKWLSHICINCKSKYLGYFTTELEASNAYQNALLKINQSNQKQL